ncbi:tRNA-splicing ligase RtcB [Deinobacterium chartae]|uniref:3'-phosphate/5'-hydroxy nucleic acid ligase n=1 Tax=Deinobacterium chartae TaxID=521158 RepID=A0A841I564_9DEIO|nr:RtcB family protein [Deinobacterium chartae]MBB6099015.1 tRNA-splicing ligase RtcB [Deinobacterium chartae]
MNGKDIIRLGLKGHLIGLALKAADARKGLSKRELLDELSSVIAHPQDYLDQPPYRGLAEELLKAESQQAAAERSRLRELPLAYDVWGPELIEDGARRQMNVAMRLPVSVAGALMPDAHVGYGLPIGGVLATRSAVIPYGVGVDIGCSMMLSVLPVENLERSEMLRLLQRHTRFGAGVGWEGRERPDHDVLDDPAWRESKLLGYLHGKAAQQIGTSGSGNHFVEFGTFRLDEPDLGLEAGEYVAVLSHSGSRGTGAQIAGHFTRVAERLHPHLDPEARKLAWLDLDSDDGQAYWQAMTLAGRYALANHEIIHARIAKALGVRALAQVSNSHNLAWKAELNGEQVVVHRKGATPAAAGQLGIIPGSMADPGYVVRGLGEPRSLESASHGAGRAMGRKDAERRIPKADMRAYLEARGVTLIGGGIDEAPMAYKRIDDVIAAQGDLVSVVGQFKPQVVRMDTGSEDI